MNHSFYVPLDEVNKHFLMIGYEDIRDKQILHYNYCALRNATRDLSKVKDMIKHDKQKRHAMIKHNSLCVYKIKIWWAA